MAVRTGDDPRLNLPTASTQDVRPVVALPRRGLPGWMLVVLALAAGALLFTILESRRRAATAPAVQPIQTVATPAPPPLLVPPEPRLAERAPVPAPSPTQQPPTAAPAPQPQIVYVPQPTSPPPYVEPQAPPPRVSTEPALVLDAGGPAATQPGGETQAGDAAALTLATGIAGSRARAGALANRSTTVPQGTLIQAVLETALDSTRPGLARAIVSRDVRGFDGSRVLIPRGSRLIGEYRSEVQTGQRRAFVNWLRLIRPDGVTIAIGSPSGDPLGRGGIRARVNTHFFQRFADAILQTALDIGVNLAASRAGDGAVIVLPGGLQGTTAQVVQPRQITPTLTVRQGTSISVFVARDLDFTGAEVPR